jgi:hypothetical protein
VSRERVWANAIHHVVADGITPEQAVDDAIVRINACRVSSAQANRSGSMPTLDA